MKFWPILGMLCLVLAGSEANAQGTYKPTRQEIKLERQGRQCLERFRTLAHANQHEQALAYLRKGLMALDAHKELPVWNELASAQGEIQKLLGRRLEALATYRQCLELATSDKQQARLYNRMAAVFVESSQVDSSLAYVAKSEALMQHLPADLQLQVWNDHIAGVAYLTTDEDQAEMRLHRAYKLAKTVDPENVTILLSHLAALAERSGYLEQARDCYKEAAEKAMASGAILNHLWVMWNLAQVYHKMGEDDQAFRWMQRKDSLEYILRREQLNQAVGGLTNEVALAHSTSQPEHLEKNVQVAEVRSNLAILALGASGLICGLLFLSFRKASRQRKALAKAHAELDAATQGLKENAANLETANRTKALLLSVISHDLRTPLASLQGVMGLVRDVDLPQEDFKLLAGRIDQDLGDCRLLLDDLLLWAKSQMEGLRVDISRQDTGELLATVLRQERALALEKHVTLHFDETGEAAASMADEGLLKTVVRNLVVNAVQHSSKGGVVTVSVRAEKGDVRICIANAQGTLSAQDQYLLTSQKPGALDKRMTARNGFGLVLVKDFVRLMNGRAEVMLPPGGGTAITIVLPQATAVREPALA